ncbi:xaa-Pro aminopeptidase 1 [Brachionus plicatilis]|uniref:Xaa-Pro aminopeptidase 1 n=1 Tax=Brachionus plicatilis TaxID=10195 RepID=A0A3M7Q487_BRAPC|nr:xaa-Pro aminopeptidase 1 [Brachionus plicatilis]
MSTKDTTKLLAGLRTLMKDSKILNSIELSAYIIPSTDAHNSEYLSPKDKRRHFISNFSGSAGTALVTDKNALLWTDGRYFLQASQELDSNWILMKDGFPETPSIADWLCTNLPRNSNVGIDATLYQHDLYSNLDKKLCTHGLSLVNTKQNLVDLIWKNKPVLNFEPLLQIDSKYTGLSTKQKLEKIRSEMGKKSVFSSVVTSLDEVAWLLNIRGHDIPFGAVFFSYLIIDMDKIILFTKLSRFSEHLKSHLKEQDLTFEFFEYEDFYSYFQGYVSQELIKRQHRILLSSSSNHFIHSLVPNELIVEDLSILSKLKCVKNQSEIEAAKKIHIRDSVVLTDFLYKLDACFKGKSLIEEKVLNEHDLAEFLDKKRSEQEGFFACSFETICGFGSNGAIIHYKPKLDENNKKIEKNNFLLIDSGGHYSDMGTTDVTRTVYLGDISTCSKYKKECFTRVLKGHIQLAMRIFPNGTRPEHLDSFARQALWEVGLDYRHGTGHGVGALLNVHEVPVIANRKGVDIFVNENMIITDEPGYYETGNFGIRIENCNLTIKANTKYQNASNVDFITFEPLTLVPIQKDLVVKDLLNSEELNWLNSYHQRCFDIVGQELLVHNNNDAYEWLKEQTQPL